VSVAGLFYSLQFAGTQPQLIITGSAATLTGIHFTTISPIKPNLPPSVK
jgi:hypothetical protein